MQEFTLHEMCPYSKFFWSVFSRIRTEYEERLGISPYSVRMRENADKKNSRYGHFLDSVIFDNSSFSRKLYSWKKSITDVWEGPKSDSGDFY